MLTLDSEVGRIIYQRYGEFSQKTRLNHDIANGFMREASLSKDIVVVASDGLDIPKRRVTDLTRPEALVSEAGLGIIEDGGLGHYEIQIPERVIGQRAGKGIVNEEQYQAKLLQNLNSEIANGLSDILFKEKLDWTKQKQSYFRYAWMAAVTAIAHPTAPVPQVVIGCYLFTNIISSAKRWRDGFGTFQNRQGLGILLLPLVPVDHYLKGQYQLARHSGKLIQLTSG